MEKLFNRKFLSGGVYLLCDPSTNLFKIGVTAGSVSKRIDELQTGNSCEIHLVAFHETDIPFFIESSLHRHFREKHSINEWYELDVNDISSFEDTCMKYEKI